MNESLRNNSRRPSAELNYFFEEEIIEVLKNDFMPLLSIYVHYYYSDKNIYDESKQLKLHPDDVVDQIS